MVVGRKKIYYGWIIVAVGVIMMMSYGIVNNCISLYVVPICNELGFTRKAGAFMSTLYSAGGMLVSAVSSSLYQAIPVKKVHARRRGDAERSLLLLFLCG